MTRREKAVVSPSRSTRMERRGAPGTAPQRRTHQRRSPGRAAILLWEDVLPRERGGRAFEDLDLRHAHPGHATQLNQLAPLRGHQPITLAAIDLALRHPSAQARLTDAEIARASRDRLTLRDQIQRSTPELRRSWCGHPTDYLPRRSSPQIMRPGKRVTLHTRDGGRG